MRHGPMLIAVLALVPALVDAKPRPTPKGKRAVKAHMNRATRAHEAGKFEVALTELQAAYALEPQPRLLFAIAQVQAKLEQCEGAIGNYEKFLATTKDKNQRSVVKQAIAACKSRLAAAAPPAPDAPPPSDTVFRDKRPAEQPAVATATEVTPVTEAPAPSPPAAVEPPPAPAPVAPPAPITDDRPPPARPARGGSGWYTDVLGDALVVGGVAAGAISFVMYRRARADLDVAEDAASIDQYQDLVDRAHDRRTYAVLLAGGSAVLIGAGLLRYALRDSGETRGVAVVPSAGGGLVTWSGGF